MHGLDRVVLIVVQVLSKHFQHPRPEKLKKSHLPKTCCIAMYQKSLIQKCSDVAAKRKFIIMYIFVFNSFQVRIRVDGH